MAESTRQFINLPGRPTSLPFSDGVLVRDTLYLAGRIGIDPATGTVPTDVNAELMFLFDGIEAVLRQAEMTMDDLVYVQIFSPDISLCEDFNRAYVKRFSRAAPASPRLHRLRPAPFGARLEMIGIGDRRH
jgi:2-iminobutanoate/2-iminopropanoate deaminase